MARKQRPTRTDVILTPEIVDKILQGIREMLEANAEGITETLNESDAKVLAVGFPMTIDCSESAPEIDIKMRYSMAHTDRRQVHCEDPHQGTFDVIIPSRVSVTGGHGEEKKDEEPPRIQSDDEPKKGKSKRAKAKEAAQEAAEQMAAPTE